MRLVQAAVKKAFEGRTVIIPDEAGLVVLKGAVEFGHQTRLITSRCVKYTYGYASTRIFDASKHPQEKMIINSYGTKAVDYCFSKEVEKDTSVDVGKDIASPITSTLSKEHTTYMKIFASTERDPEYVTDPSCSKIGELAENHPGRPKKRIKYRFSLPSATRNSRLA